MGNPIKTLFKPIEHVYCYLLILGLVSNYSVLIYDNSLSVVISILGLSVVTAYIEATIYALISGTGIKRLFLLAFAILHNAICMTEYFLLLNFHTIICQDTIDILSETNPDEIANFTSAYLRPLTVFLYLFAIAALNFTAWALSKSIVKVRLFKMVNFAFLVFGIIISAYTCTNFVLYRNGMSMPQRTSLTRLAYSFYIMKQRSNSIENLANLCQNVRATCITPPDLTFIVIIGESFSLYHSQLYGYTKQTNPLLSEYKADGSLIVYDNVVSLDDHTHNVMKSVFSLSPKNNDFCDYPLFPVCFKKAGYYTALYDNQYFIDNGITFLSDKRLSDEMFAYRNTNSFIYDGDLVKSIAKKNKPSLYIIHLQGQHYTYANRYPAQFKRFKASDYDKKHFTQAQRETIAHYDNATLYNDYVVNEIINKFKDDKCCIVYFTDHGEEVFECRDYMGHGNAAHSPDLDFQIHIPFMIWMSPAFKKDNITLEKKLKAAHNRPISTDDVSHFLLDLAGINTATFDKTRSFINADYDLKRHRIVLKSIDYDADTVK